ncbi:MAG: fatty acid desaturase [Myxococcales bacterium]|nr:fatty acid desaturase [Myxococcales bacterium]MCB9627411.1 fatty acid desaturase [Sandaracinaceae bacterium]
MPVNAPSTTRRRKEAPARFAPLAARDVDLAGFARDLDALKRAIRADAGPADLEHLAKIERWGRACSALGYATATLVPNPLSAFLISQGRLTRWAMVAHHVSHRGYDHVPGVPEERTSRRFAAGRRRYRDWLDWIDPQAWNVEHNRLHHYRLGETADPDLVEANLDWLRESPLPRPVRMAIIAFFASTWKWTYYAPNTLRVLLDDASRRERGDKPGADAATQADGDPRHARTLASMWAEPELWTRCLLPYASVHFGLLPLLFLPLGPVAAGNVLANSLLAEWFTNLHSFLIITTNHAGEDMYAFEEPVRDGKGEFYFRQVVGSTNFRTGGDLNDFLHGFLNYQIEHHVFPDMSMRQYQLMQPAVRELCEKYGVPYVQESVFTRLRKTLAVMLGDADMLREAPPAAQTA